MSSWFVRFLLMLPKRTAKQSELVLSCEDSKAFAEAILNPPEPDDALRMALIRHQQILSD